MGIIPFILFMEGLDGGTLGLSEGKCTVTSTSTDKSFLQVADCWVIRKVTNENMMVTVSVEQTLALSRPANDIKLLQPKAMYL